MITACRADAASSASSATSASLDDLLDEEDLQLEGPASGAAAAAAASAGVSASSGGAAASSSPPDESPPDYVIAQSLVHHKKINVVGDRAAYVSFKMHLYTSTREICLVGVRRKFIPPYCDTFQDIVFIGIGQGTPLTPHTSITQPRTRDSNNALNQHDYVCACEHVWCMFSLLQLRSALLSTTR
jgi:hypothetical protein